MGIRESFWAALGRDVSDSPDAALERVRKAMLLVVDEYGGENHYRLDMKINFARDVAELWYLRPEAKRSRGTVWSRLPRCSRSTTWGANPRALAGCSWSGRWESNPRYLLGKQESCH
jgi:hypothetical protein